jgi:cellulose biosynthesis protein BcsQ
MSIPVLTFFNNKGGVGKTSLVYHLSWMFSELGKRIVAIDLDPQANLTSAFLPDEQLEALWDTDTDSDVADTIYKCVRPLTKVGDILEPQAKAINEFLTLVPGDLSLASFEGRLSEEWPKSVDSGELYRPFRILTAFWQVAQMAAKKHQADLILADVGPNLGAINRSALISSDHVVIPLGADSFSLQGLRNLGPTLRSWRTDWNKRLANWPSPEFGLPSGTMQPAGYIVLQHTERLSRPVKAYNKWADRIPNSYRNHVLDAPSEDVSLESDPYCLARLKHYRSLVPMAQEIRKPIFHLTAANGAIGSHSYAVTDARKDFNALTLKIAQRIGITL